MKNKNLSLGLHFFIFFLISCSPDNSGKVAIEVKDPEPKQIIITGTAAAGFPIVGIVNVLGANGLTASAHIDSSGAYSLDVTSLTAPYILFAKGTANGQSVELYSTGVSAGNINITPVTHYIASMALEDDPKNAFGDWASASGGITAEVIQTAELTVQTQLDAILDAIGLPDNIDLMSASFQADHTGMDALLDAVQITIDGTGSATLTNNYTGTTVSGGTPFDPSEGDPITTALSDINEIDIMWNVIESLYATGQPSATDLNDQFAVLIADDFLDQGLNKTLTLDRWVAGEGPPVGVIIDAAIIRPLTSSEYNTGLYSKAYLISMKATIGTAIDHMITSVVHNGSNWLWYGDQEILRIDADAIVHKRKNKYETVYRSGFHFHIHDEYNFAWDIENIKTIVITGPGLPSNGLISARNYPDDGFNIWNGTEWQEDKYWIESDSVIDNIPENSTYTFKICRDTSSDVVANNGACSNVYKTGSRIIAGKPVKNAVITTASFANLLSPGTFELSELSLGSTMILQWANPQDSHVEFAEFFLGDESNHESYFKKDLAGVTSAVLDISSSSITNPNYAGVLLRWYDILGREFRLEINIW